MQKETGIVMFWTGKYGFIHRSVNGKTERFFFHLTECAAVPKVGDGVLFQIGPNKNGKGPVAVDVEIAGGVK